MFFHLRFTEDGAEIGVVLNWQRLRGFVQALIYTIWFIVSLVLMLKAASVDLPAILSW